VYSAITTNTVIICYKAIYDIVAFRIAEYYKDIENFLKGLQMALNKIVTICYVIDTQCDNDIGELG
jgi:hypothetical protein